MSIASACKPFAVAAFAATSVLTAQDWTVTSTFPLAPFGNARIANDTMGVLMCDENSTQTFDLVGGAWAPTTPAPQPHTLYGTTIGGGTSVWRFGGIGPTALSNTIMRFDRATASWVTLTPGPITPTPRLYAAGACTNAGTAIVFGGHDGSVALGDTWQVTDFNGAAVWLQLTPASAPAARLQHSMARGPNNSVVLFGGIDAAANALGDTWVLKNGTWAPIASGPPAVAGASMTFDPGRNMTVLVHPNGETWEWNDFYWRRVGALGAPLLAGAQVAFDATSNVAIVLQQNGSDFELLSFTPSPARYQITLPQNAMCIAIPGGTLPFRLANLTRNLPIIGQNLDTVLDRVAPSALLIGAFEFATSFVGPMNCNCNQGVTLTGATQFIPNVGGVGNWSLPIANTPALWGMMMDMQGFAFDPLITCPNLQVASTARATITMGR